MFFLPLAAVAWMAALWVIDWGRVRTLLPYAAFGTLICLAEDQLGLWQGWWAYQDGGLVGEHTGISAVIALSAAPLFAMAFAQKLRPGGPVPWRRVVFYTAVAMLPEFVAARTGKIVYQNGWGLGWSILAYLPTWLGLWALHRRVTRGAPALDSPPAGAP